MKTKVLIVLIFCCLNFTSANANWRYKSSVDEMTSKSEQFAYLKSKNSLNLAFPYQGRNFAEIMLRHSAKGKINVLIYIEQGQIHCSDKPCSLEIRFDDALPESFVFLDSADQDRTTVFIDNEEKFIQLASNAKQILVKLPIYMNGENILKFTNSKPLVWAKDK